MRYTQYYVCVVSGWFELGGFKRDDVKKKKLEWNLYFSDGFKWRGELD